MNDGTCREWEVGDTVYYRLDDSEIDLQLGETKFQALWRLEVCGVGEVLRKDGSDKYKVRFETRSGHKTTKEDIPKEKLCGSVRNGSQQTFGLGLPQKLGHTNKPHDELDFFISAPSHIQPLWRLVFATPKKYKEMLASKEEQVLVGLNNVIYG